MISLSISQNEALLLAEACRAHHASLLFYSERHPSLSTPLSKLDTLLSLNTRIQSLLPPPVCEEECPGHARTARRSPRR